ncbi:unnamed protein product [Rhizoctonia solani]|uniref:F-box domain-containing protein n=1 Tax=Rhizoctonia solani TaxID=456999 RepID=A0A8H3H6B9_9AGAM|nr:unnamed protein product [Rhizoctonia solani]
MLSPRFLFMSFAFQFLGSIASLHSCIMATRRLLEQYMLHAAAAPSTELAGQQPLSIDTDDASFGHDAVLKAIKDVQSQIDSCINRLPTELLSKIFEFVSEERDGAIVQLSHVCNHWRRIALFSSHAWSKVMADMSPPANDPKVERALVYLARSGACPIDVEVIASHGDNYDPSNGIMDALYSHIPRWRSFSFHCSSSGVSNDVIKSLNGAATALQELRFVFQPGPRAHGEYPRMPANFLVQAPLLRLLQLNGVAVNLNWLSSLQHLETLELVQNGNSPLVYGDLLRAVSSCASSLRNLKIHATISNTGTSSVPRTHLVLPSLHTLDLILQTSPVASVLGDIEAPALECLSLQDIRNPSDRWCSLGLRSFLRQPASRLRQLRLCSIGLEDDELIWALGRMPGLETLELIHSTNTDILLRSLAQPMPDMTSESWVTPALHTLKMEQCHQITGTALVECIKSRNTSSLNSVTHVPIQDLRVQNCYRFERRHSVKLGKLTPFLNLDVAVISSFSFGLGGMRSRSPYENVVLGLSLPH